jgi:hypothetical protein
VLTSLWTCVSPRRAAGKSSISARRMGSSHLGHLPEAKIVSMPVLPNLFNEEFAQGPAKGKVSPGLGARSADRDPCRVFTRGLFPKLELFPFIRETHSSRRNVLIGGKGSQVRLEPI